MTRDNLSILGVDIGGSSIKAAPVEIETGKLLSASVNVPTPDNCTPDDIRKLVKKIVNGFRWSGRIGVGYPGVVVNSKVRDVTWLSRDDWLGVDVAELIRSVTGLETSVINDADAAGIAEVRFGAGRNFDSPSSGTLLLATLGTGIGTALFRGGCLIPNTEFGHLFFADGTEAEQLAAGSVRRREKLSWEEYASRVNRFIVEIQKLVSPSLMIIGGGVSENFEKLSPFLTNSLSIKGAELKNDAGMIGAVLYAGDLKR